MNDAWTEAPAVMGLGCAARRLREVFAHCLRRVWAKAKAAAALLARSAASLWAEMHDLENRDRLGFQGVSRLRWNARGWRMSSSSWKHTRAGKRPA